jgi:hypothetical protein
VRVLKPKPSSVGFGFTAVVMRLSVPKARAPGASRHGQRGVESRGQEEATARREAAAEAGTRRELGGSCDDYNGRQFSSKEATGTTSGGAHTPRGGAAVVGGVRSREAAVFPPP